MKPNHKTGSVLGGGYVALVEETLPLVAPRSPRFELVSASGAALAMAPLVSSLLRNARGMWDVGTVVISERGSVVLAVDGSELGTIRPIVKAGKA